MSQRFSCLHFIGIKRSWRPSFGPSACAGLAALLLAGAAAGLSGCASSTRSATLSHYRDYALAVGEPYPAEASVAQTRVDHYLARLTPERRKALESYQYLAVEATTVPATEVAALVKHLVNTGAVAGSLAHETYNLSATTAQFVMVFDVKTGRPVSNEGYVAIDTPRRGQPGLFGGYDAIYIGTGK
ncbi:MAG: hypothetical protein JO015_01950 [Verrucomicrobia bacterium]|nr:hypothetical protein [Verrucomicrobiota bacterium]